MQSNLSNYITPVNNTPNKNVKTTLEGVGVTPFNQSFHHSVENGFDILQIADDTALSAKFPRDTFPRIEIMNNGDVFVKPCKHVITSTENHYIKWLIFNKHFKPVHGHSYPMTKLPIHGYIMKIIVPVLSDQPDEFQIEYFMDYHNIQVEVTNSINGISQIESQNQQTSVQIDAQGELSIKGYSLGEYKEIDNLISDKKAFFDNYVKDVFDVD